MNRQLVDLNKGAHLPWQTTPASSAWTQLFSPKPGCWQSWMKYSFPWHMTSSIQIGPLPGANLRWWKNI